MPCRRWLVVRGESRSVPDPEHARCL